MPDGVNPSDVPLDGVMPPENNPAPPPEENENGQNDPGTEEAVIEEPHVDRRKLLLPLLAVGGVLLLFTLFFAFYLMTVLPDSSGLRQGLRLFGNVYYGGVSLLAIALPVLLALRLLRGGLDPNQLPQALLRPGIVTVSILGISAMVFLTINGEIPLPIDVLEPESLNGLTAPVTMTFGTDSLRSILRNQGIAPRQYRWDFNGDGTVDADTQETDVTTVYKRKGIVNVQLRILLSNGNVRSTSFRLTIPNIVFSLEPPTPILQQETLLDASNLFEDPTKIETIQWDFNGDGTVDQATADPAIKHTFTELGTFPVQATVQYVGGLRETFTRTVTVLEKPMQSFVVTIKTEGETTGSVPIGLVLMASTEKGIIARTYDWQITAMESRGGRGQTEQKTGDRIHHVFADAGEYLVTLTVTDNRGRRASNSIPVHALEPLTVKDIVINGTPRPTRNAVEGTAPLDLRLSAATETPFITFTWEQEGAKTVYSTEESFHALYEAQGTYPVVLVAHDEQGRTQRIPVEVTVLPPRSNVAFTAIPSTGIAPINVTFDASESFIPDARITGFAWTFGDSANREEKPKLLGAKVTHRFETEGTYTVVVRALTEDGRSFDARKTIVVRSPTLSACILPSRTTGSAPMGVRFDASCSTGTVTKYLWTFGDGATSEQTEPVQDHVFDRSGTFTVILEVSDTYGNFDQKSVKITVSPVAP